MIAIRSVFSWLLMLGAIAISVVLFRQSGAPMEWLSSSMPPGQIAYLLSKWLGLLVLWGWQLQVFMQYVPVQWLKIDAQVQRQWHKRLGLFIFLGALFHCLLFVTAASIRNGHFAGKLLTLQLDSYYQTRVSLGLIALLLLIAAVLPRLLSRVSLFYHNQKLFNLVHMLNLPAFILVMWHALSIGSEAQSTLLFAGFAGAFIINLILLLRSLGKKTTPLSKKRKPQ